MGDGAFIGSLRELEAMVFNNGQLLMQHRIAKLVSERDRDMALEILALSVEPLPKQGSSSEALRHLISISKIGEQ